jgi:hypothetical protein
MAGITHTFVSGKTAAADATLVDGPNWDAAHTGVEWYRTTGDHVNATTTPTDVSGLAFALAASEIVNFRLEFMAYSSAATVGVRLQFTGPASPTLVTIAGIGWSSATAVLPIAVAAFATDMVWTGDSATAGVPNLHIVHGYIQNGSNSGTVQAKIGTEVAGTVTIKRGAWLAVYR